MHPMVYFFFFFGTDSSEPRSKKKKNMSVSESVFGAENVPETCFVHLVNKDVKSSVLERYDTVIIRITSCVRSQRCISRQIPDVMMAQFQSV